MFYDICFLSLSLLYGHVASIETLSGEIVSLVNWEVSCSLGVAM
jgi:hypothetical protein